MRAPETFREWLAWSSAALVLPIVAGLGFAFLFPLLVTQISPIPSAVVAGLWGLAIALPLSLNALIVLSPAAGRREVPVRQSRTSIAASSPRFDGALGARARRKVQVHGRVKLTLTIASIVAMLLGAGWPLQGTGVVPLGWMANHLTWAFRGAALFIFGLLTLIFARSQ